MKALSYLVMTKYVGMIVIFATVSLDVYSLPQTRQERAAILNQELDYLTQNVTQYEVWKISDSSEKSRPAGRLSPDDKLPLEDVYFQDRVRVRQAAAKKRALQDDDDDFRDSFETEESSFSTKKPLIPRRKRADGRLTL
jgi:hypothetical protein